jgi:mono/diheme cytochrome c family protein
MASASCRSVRSVARPLSYLEKPTARTVKALTRFVWLAFAIAAIPAAAGVAAAGVDYTRDVKPLFKSRCWACHGALKQEAGLRLDTAELARKGGEDGPVLVPGDPTKSELVRRVKAAQDDGRMPPEGRPLTGEQVALLSRWIAAGANGPAAEKPAEDPRRHWAFQVPARRPAPRVAAAALSNPIDAFLADRQMRHGLTPLGEADKATQLRRVYWDLIGLPPTVAQLQDFLADPRPDAWERVVDQLLANPHYGERWGRHWMDIWRYSDWYGLGKEVRNAQKYMWHWRDWIVESLNAAKGYDRMLEEMLAADEIAPLDTNARRATGFLVRNYFLFNRTTWLDTTVEHTSKAFLGVTLNCAKCHDHKFDPFSQVDYYRFRAIFEPYQVRMEIFPGQTDLERDGLPTVFDAHLDAPTYLLRRGDEKQPDRSQSLAPGVPAVLESPAFVVTPVSLPVEAWWPSLRPDVRGTFLAEADGRVERAVRDLESARNRLEVTNARRAKTAALDDPKTALRVARIRVKCAGKSLRAAEAHRSMVSASLDLDRARQRGVSAVECKRLAAVAAELARTESLLQADADEAQIELARASGKAAFSPEKAAKRRQIARKKAIEHSKGPLDIAALAAIRAPEGPAQPGPVRGTPYPLTSTGRRSALARWLVDRTNPLTARVAVNHVWMRHMNRPLVESVTDFGLRSPSPPELELLDWLANDLMDHRWNLKRLDRLIVTSRAYRRSSDGNQADGATRQADPEGVYFWKYPATRLEAEEIRDGLFYIAGALDERLGGPTIDPKQEMAPRRSLYFNQSMDEHERFLSTFDAADVLQCYRRDVSVLPQQALALANSRVTLQMAAQIAARLDRDTPAADGTKRTQVLIESAFRSILTRDPTTEEVSACIEFLNHAKTLVPDKPNRDRQILASLIVALLNHNDFVAVR